MDARTHESACRVLKRIRAQLPDLAESAKNLPKLVHGVIQQASEGRFRLRVESAGIEELRLAVDESNARRDIVTVSSALLLGGIVWLAIAAAGTNWAGWVLSVAGIAGLFTAWQREARHSINGPR